MELTWGCTIAERVQRYQLVERVPRRSLVAVGDRIGGLHRTGHVVRRGRRLGPR
jgi:hypothetical protein